jgi:hypothetical protein
MEDWLAIGRLIHVLFGVFTIAAVTLTVRAVCRFPKTDLAAAGRSPVRSQSDELRRRLGASAAGHDYFGSNDTRVREGI